MTKRPADPLNLKEQQRDHEQRYDAASERSGANKPEFQERMPTSHAKIVAVRDYLRSDDYEPKIGEILTGEHSANGSLTAMLKSIDQAKRAEAKGPKYADRDRFLPEIAKKVAQEKPHYRGKRRDEYIRDLIIEAIECRIDRTRIKCTLHDWFGHEDAEIYNDQLLELFRLKTTGNVISAKTIGNILSRLL